jgi:hypothetical protein
MGTMGSSEQTKSDSGGQSSEHDLTPWGSGSGERAACGGDHQKHLRVKRSFHALRDSAPGPPAHYTTAYGCTGLVTHSPSRTISQHPK